MEIPNKFTVETKDFIQIQTMLSLHIAKYGSKAVSNFLSTVPIRIQKKDGKNLGHYIEAKILEEFKISNFELFESTKRKEITQARQLLCVFTEKYLQVSRTEMAKMFHRSRHSVRRLILDFEFKLNQNHARNKKFIDSYRRLDSLISAYVEFKSK
jgi:chromosomal replication initiation ATPase DnaA